MKIHHLTADEARHSLQTPADGLSESEAARRLHEFGPNRVERIQGESLALRLLKNFTHFFALILWLAAGLALFAEFSDPGKGMLLLAGAIVGVIVINGLFAFWQEYRAEQALAAFFFVLHSGGWNYGAVLAANDLLYLQATTACLTAIVLMQVLNVYLCRSERDSLLANGLFTNPLILWGIGAELGLALFIVYTPWGNLLFGTAPISGAVWLWVLPFAGALVVLEEARKAWVRRRNPARPVAT